MKQRTGHMEALRRVKELVEQLNSEVDLVIVEGAHDSKALKLMGLSKPVLEISKSKKPLFEVVDWVVERFRRKRVALLLDFDDEGEKLAARLISEFSQRGVAIDLEVRESFRGILKNVGVKSIEGIALIKRAALEGEELEEA